MKHGNRTAQNGPSLAAVAARAGVSIATVSRIVNGQTDRASTATTLRVRQAIALVGYHPNQLGRALRSQESRLVAMLAANLDNPVMATIAASTEAALRHAGFTMILCDTHDRADLQDDYLSAMRAQVVQGYVMVATQDSPGLRDVVARGAPVVFVSRRSPVSNGAFVGADNLAAGSDAADYLVKRGIEPLGVVAPSPGSSSSNERLHGFLDRARALGAPPPQIARAAGGSHLEIGYAAAVQFATGWPAGIMCVSDQIAYGVHRRAREAEIAVPSRCELVGIDGNPINAWLAPWLTSIEIPHQDVGPNVVDLLTGMWAGETPADRLLPHRLAAASQR